MTNKTIYYAEAFDPTIRSYRVGIFRERATAEAWTFGFDYCDIEPKITPVYLTDHRYNHNLEGDLNQTLFRVHWLPDGAEPVRPSRTRT